MKKISILLCLSLLMGACSQKKKENQDAEMNRFIGSLLKQMTLEEKIGQLNLPVAGDITTGQAENSDVAKKIKEGKVGGLFNIKGSEKIREVQRLAVEESRLKIPLLFGMDVIHGYETVFPIPLGLACSWDMQAIEQSARIAAIEASADGICWTFSPMVDLCRDARWGRIAEGNGEDPFLGGEIAKAMVRGYQGNDLTQNNTIMACVKHFALYGASESGRDYNTVDMSRVRMFNEYLWPYHAAVEAGAGSIMASFNEIDGIPATANRWLLTDVLRKQWGFNGFVVSDYTGVSEMIDHGIGDLKTVSAKALNAGLDMDMVSEGLPATLSESLEEGQVTEAQIDAACRRILEAKYKLGLFSDPYKYCDQKRAGSEIYTKEHRTIARKIAAESFVLLKDDKQILPLKKQGTIALIGPLADSGANMAGTWSVATKLDRIPGLLEGMKEVVGDKVRILYAKGSNLTEDAELEKRSTVFGRDLKRDERPEQVIINEAVQTARNADVIIAALGESSEMSGESSSRTDIKIPETQRKLLKALVQTGKPVVLVLFTGRPLALVWENENVPAILNTWFGGSEAAYAIADVLFGDVNPSGKLTASFPQNIGQIPIFYNHKNTGRPLAEGKWFQKFRSNYLDVSNEPLYPFGYGLSYTTFNYGAIRLSSDSFNANGELTASVVVTNTGERAGKEIIQLYIRDLVGSITRPVKELKGFEKISLEPGESKTVTFTITPELLRFYNNDLKYDYEPGDFVLMIGSNSRDVQTASFSLQ
ncbi:MAG: beta-glucosidase BglX [Dysgonamonadaceae bacterium]|jgi:beta-glucosidase|nr:beta-glucosidase BglX [Dysgonamonadaceae bacterium]